MRSPIDQLFEDREAARSNGDPCANLCTVATVDENNVPHARTLVLREVGSRLALFVNQTSPKFKQVTASGVACVVVWLPTLSLQYRLHCNVAPVEKALIDESWKLRPKAPKQLDWYYTTRAPQSSEVADRERLLRQVAAFDQHQHEAAPATARGWYLQPFYVDRLDLNDPSGVHDRRGYSLQGGIWQQAILVP